LWLAWVFCGFAVFCLQLFGVYLHQAHIKSFDTFATHGCIAPVLVQLASCFIFMAVYF